MSDNDRSPEAPCEDRVEELTLVIMALGRSYPDEGGRCWCDMGIGNPMLREHTLLCQKVREVMR